MIPLWLVINSLRKGFHSEIKFYSAHDKQLTIIGQG